MTSASRCLGTTFTYIHMHTRTHHAHICTLQSTSRHVQPHTPIHPIPCDHVHNVTALVRPLRVSVQFVRLPVRPRPTKPGRSRLDGKHPLAWSTHRVEKHRRSVFNRSRTIQCKVPVDTVARVQDGVGAVVLCGEDGCHGILFVGRRAGVCVQPYLYGRSTSQTDSQSTSQCKHAKAFGLWVFVHMIQSTNHEETTDSKAPQD